MGTWQSVDNGPIPSLFTITSYALGEYDKWISEYHSQAYVLASRDAYSFLIPNSMSPMSQVIRTVQIEQLHITECSFLFEPLVITASSSGRR